MDRTRCRRSIITPSNYVDDNETKQRENIAKTVARGRIRFNRNFLIFCFASAVSYKRQRRSEITRTDNEEVLFNFLRVRKKTSILNSGLVEITLYFIFLKITLVRCFTPFVIPVVDPFIVIEMFHRASGQDPAKFMPGHFARPLRVCRFDARHSSHHCTFPVLPLLNNSFVCSCSKPWNRTNTSTDPLCG